MARSVHFSSPNRYLTLHIAKVDGLIRFTVSTTKSTREWWVSLTPSAYTVSFPGSFKEHEQLVWFCIGRSHQIHNYTPAVKTVDSFYNQQEDFADSRYDDLWATDDLVADDTRL